MSAPSLHIVVALEAPPLVYVDALHEGEFDRLADWFAAHPAVAAFIEQAVELAERERAA